MMATIEVFIIVFVFKYSALKIGFEPIWEFLPSINSRVPYQLATSELNIYSLEYMVGVERFERPILVPKTSALPLGDTPISD